MTMLRYCLILCSTLPFFVAHEVAAQPVADTVEVTVEGAVNAPGIKPLATGARLAEAAIAAAPSDDAYVLGAALMRASARAEQIRLKAGLLFDLTMMQRDADQQLNLRAAALAESLTDLPVTGRVRQALDPRLMQIRPSENPVAAAGDSLWYPSRPSSVRVVGAVMQSCELPHDATADVTRYVRDCTSDDTADKNVVYIIQPDGQIQIAGIALWNRSDLMAVAPGGTVYVPVAERSISRISPEFNAQFAEFLATQLLPHARVAP